MSKAYRHHTSACIALLLLAVFASLSPALAQQDYPARQIKVVVPFLAGGAVDVVVRLVFNKISERWNQVIVVENRPGAGGNLGADMVAKSEPDGYTLLATPPSVLVINQYLYDKMPFDPAEAFAPVSLIGLLPNVLVVGPSVKATTLREWIDEAKQQPDKFSYASQGVGTTGHLTGAMLNVAAGLGLRHIPYRGFPPALADMISGRIRRHVHRYRKCSPPRREGQLAGPRRVDRGAHRRAARRANVQGDRPGGCDLDDMVRGRGAGQDKPRYPSQDQR